MEAPALANFYDLTHDDAPVGQLPEIINLTSVSSSSESDEEQPIPRRVKRRTLVSSSSESDEEEQIARRVKRRTGRQQISHFAGAYRHPKHTQPLAERGGGAIHVLFSRSRTGAEARESLNAARKLTPSGDLFSPQSIEWESQ